MVGQFVLCHVREGLSVSPPPPGQYLLLHRSSPLSSQVPDYPKVEDTFSGFTLSEQRFYSTLFSRIPYCLGTLKFYLYPCPVLLYVWWFTWSVFSSMWEHENMQPCGSSTILLPGLEWSCCWVHTFWVTQRSPGALPGRELMGTSPIPW